MARVVVAKAGEELLGGVVDRFRDLDVADLASGTELEHVRREAEVLGLTPFFGEHIYGALDDYRKFSKRMVIERILRDHNLGGEALLGFGDGYVEIEEIKRVAKMGFRFLTLPCKPMFGGHDSRDTNYNLNEFDPMWAAIQGVDLPITFHVSTGRDPRAARKEGGAVINYVAHSLSPSIEPVASICGSGVIERFPKIKFASVESGIGWVPWALDAMDEAAVKHHLWAYPKLKKLPSEYFRSNGAATFQEDKPGLMLAEAYNLVDNFMWANDYPHAEGTWPHSAQAVEREMGSLKEESRAKILGLNAAKMFKFDVELLLRRRTERLTAN